LNDASSAKGGAPFATVPHQGVTPQERGVFDTQLRVTLRVSPRLVAAVLISHAAALAATVTGLGPLPAAIVSAGILLSCVHQARVALQRSALSVIGLLLSPDGRCEIQSRDGWIAATLRSAVVPADWLAALTLCDSAGRKRVLLILPDAIDAAAFRRLRVWLRWRSTTFSHRHDDAPDLR
jgi:hypothetical protein